ncbi:hypothetical protein CRYUN_Cryun08bG0068500 [Craigia yunnanensis]
MEEQEQEVEPYHFISKPADWFTSLISLQADILYNCFINISSPFFTLFSVASESYHRAEETTARVETAIQKVPSNITHGSTLLLKRVGLGLLGAAQVCMLLVFVMVLAALVGIGLVQLWLEEPVFVREKLFFDYTEVNPKAVFCFSGGGFDGSSYWKRQMAVPVGHTFNVYLVLLMPESDFNRHIGVFQGVVLFLAGNYLPCRTSTACSNLCLYDHVNGCFLTDLCHQLTAELLSTNGNVIAKSSQPVMLRFRSLPVRLARTFLMGIPLLLGISSETQKIKIEMLRSKEGHPRSDAVRVILAPRAGTSSLPQLYEAKIIMNSQLPWTKQLVHNWKWTLYVWTSLYVYILFLIILVGCFRPLLFPVTTAGFSNRDERDAGVEASNEPLISGGSGHNEVSDLISKWHHGRRKRKAIFLHKDFSDIAGSSASSMSLTREDTSVVIEEDVGDSESYIQGLGLRKGYHFYCMEGGLLSYGQRQQDVDELHRAVEPVVRISSFFTNVFLICIILVSEIKRVFMVLMPRRIGKEAQLKSKAKLQSKHEYKISLP